jgi:hypothetical protein
MTLSPSSRSMYAQPAATIYGHLPVFQHEEQDVRSFRMFTSQMIGSGTVEPKEMVKTFGVPMIAVKRYLKLYREHGSKGSTRPILATVRPRR